MSIRIAAHLLIAWVLSATAHAAESGPARTISTLVRASQAGAALDSDLSKGGGTDDTAALQGILDRAKDGHGVHLIVDGPALIAGLDVYSHTTIECTAGGGFYLKDNTARAMLRNAHRSATDIIDKHITIRGCFLNGNRHRQEIVGPENSMSRAAQEPDGTFRSGLQFFGVHYLALEKVILWDTLSFGAWIANAKFIQVEDVTVERAVAPFPEGATPSEIRAWFQANVFGGAAGPVKGNGADDGLHFNGPIQYLTINGLKLRTWDDGLSFTANHDCGDLKDVELKALCAPFNAVASPYVKGGPITDVTVSNVLFMDAHHGIRLLSADDRVDRIVISNVTGTIRERFVQIGPWFPGHAGNIGSVVFSDVNVQLAQFPFWDELFPEQKIGEEIKEYENALASGKRSKSFDPGDEAELPLFSLNGRIEALRLRNIATRVVDRGRPVIRIGGLAEIQSLTVDLGIHDPGAQAVPIKVLGRVERLNLSLDWVGQEPIQYKGGSIGNLHWE